MAKHAQRRRMRELQDSIDRITQADLNYFTRFPHRNRHLRVADPAEIEQWELVTGADMNLPPGKQHYSGVIRMSDDVCLCLVFPGSVDDDPELFDDEMVRTVLEPYSTVSYDLTLVLRKVRGPK